MSDTESDSGKEISIDELDDPSQVNAGSLSPEHFLQILKGGGDAYNLFADSVSHSIDSLNFILQDFCRQSNQQLTYILGYLVRQDTLEWLLQLRYKLRLDPSTIRRSLSPWIDHVLARLGELVLFVASGSCYQVASKTESVAIKNELESDAARAARQLPDCCDAFPVTLNAGYLSPAARRLLVRLLFGLFVMQPIIGTPGLNQCTLDIHHVIGELEASIGQYVRFEDLAGSLITEGDSVDRAFFLCLYADLSSQVNSTVAKPYVETCLLALVDMIMHSSGTHYESTSSSAVRGICFRWGNLVPWCWRTWADRRLANSEVTITVTTRWLENIDHREIRSSRGNYTLTTSHLFQNVFTSTTALSEVLSAGVKQLEDTIKIGHPLLRLLDNSCYLLSLIFRGIANEVWLQERWRFYASRVCCSVLHLCVMRYGKLDDSETLSDYLDILLAMENIVVEQCLVESQAERSYLFSGMIDQVFFKAKTLVDQDPIMPKHITMIRFALGFLTVLCNADVRGIVLRENVSSFFGRLCMRFVVDFRKHTYAEKLLVSMIVALTAAEKYFKGKHPLINDDGFWMLCFLRHESQFFISVALAQHIVLGTYSSNQFLVLQALDQFRDVMLTILKGRVPKALECVSHLACPTICIAMIRLLTEHEGTYLTKNVFINSPWTKELQADLRRLALLESTHVELGSCGHCLREVLRDMGPLLVRVLSGQDGNNASIEIPEFGSRVCLYKSQLLNIITVD